MGISDVVEYYYFLDGTQIDDLAKGRLIKVKGCVTDLSCRALVLGNI